eukprot:1513034-Prymnesium_polylepis.1
MQRDRERLQALIDAGDDGNKRALNRQEFFQAQHALPLCSLARMIAGAARAARPPLCSLARD